MFRTWRATAVAPIFWLCAVATAQQPPRDLPSETWAVMSFGGADAGYVHVARAALMPEGGGEALVHSVESSHLKMARLGSTIAIEVADETWERFDGSLVRVRRASKMSATETIVEVEFRDGKALLTTKGTGKERTREIECPSDTIGTYALSRRLEQELRNAGTSFEAKVWSTDLSKAITMKNTIFAEEEIEHLGEKLRAIRVDTEPLSKGLPKSTSFYRLDGTEIRMEVSVAGIKMVARAATREEALAATSKGSKMGPDVFTPSMIVEPTFVPAPRRAERAVVRVQPRAGEQLEVLEDDRQRLLGRKDGALLFELRSVTPPAGMRGVRPLPGGDAALPAEVRDALLPSTMIESDAPEIAKVAAEVVGEETEAWRAAQVLEAWVERNLTDKNMDVAFASALEVCRNRSGDCSEHAVFLAALGRAAGIPTRVAMGLLYIGGIWGGHAWNEVWIDGRWYALDATLGLGRCDALHLAFSKMSLKEGGFAEEFGGLLENLGKLDLSVQEIALARWVEPTRDTGRVADGWYEDAAWDIRFRVPDGAAVTLGKPKAAIGFELMSLDAQLGEDTSLRLQLRGYDADASNGWPSFLGALQGTELSVDGRPAMRIGDGSLRRVLVRSGAKVFEFKFTRVKGDAPEAAYTALLSSIDFDH